MAKKRYMYAIRHKESGSYFTTPKGKDLWAKEHHAKAAYAQHTKEYFDLQNRHEIVMFELREVRDYQKDKKKPTSFFYKKP